jgi:chromosome segregation and condensation protein ScpB
MYTLFTVTALHVQHLRGVSYNTARKEWQAIKDALLLKAGEPLKLKDLAAFWGLCPVETAETLYNIKKK